MRSIRTTAAAGYLSLWVLAGLSSIAPVAASTMPYYPTPGTENPATYTFSAVSTGNLTAYFYGTGAAFSERLGVLINGVDSGVVGLQNKASTFGEALDFGPVTAGDALTFYIIVDSINQTYYSDPGMNPGGTHQVYSESFTGNRGIPDGTYVAFEDLNPAISGLSDFNYSDEQFVFTNTASMSTVPLPASAPLFGTALLMLGVAGYRMRRKKATASI